MILESVYLEYLDALLEGDKVTCNRIIDELLQQGISIREIYIDLFQKTMYRIGKLWEENRISIADEHMASQITENLINRIPVRANEGKSYSALVSCIDKEFHQIGAKMVAHTFELNGWKTYFLGTNTPTKEIVKFVTEKNPDVVALSFGFYMNFLRFFEVINQIRKSSPEVVIFVGGQGINEELREQIARDYTGIHYFPTIKEVDDALAKYPNI